MSRPVYIKIRGSDPDPDRLRFFYLDRLLSIPEISKELSIPRSRIRSLLIFYGIGTRSCAEAMNVAKPKLSAIRSGRSFGPLSDERKKAISAARIKHSNQFAVGISIKPNGYAEYTRGPHKGRSVHVVMMEQKIGRRINTGECVHHIDENKLNNSLDNLALMTIAEHARSHRILEESSGTKRKREENGRFS